MNFTDAYRFLKETIGKTNLVHNLIGDTGIGKTELVKQLSKELFDKPPIILHLAELEPQDFIGPLVECDNRSKNLPPDWLPHTTNKKDAKGGIIFLDEFNRAKEDMRQAAMELVQSKKIHNYYLPDNWHIITAQNYTHNTETYELCEALRDRLLFIQLEPTRKEYLEYLTNKHGEHFLLDLVDTQKLTLDLTKPQELEQKLPPRRLDELIPIFDMYRCDPTMLNKVVRCFMDSKRALSVIKFYNETKTITAEEVIKGVNTKFLKEIIKKGRNDILNNLGLGVVRIVKETAEAKKKFTRDEKKNLINFFNTIPTEIMISSLYNLLQNISSKPELKKHLFFYSATFIKGCKERLEEYYKYSEGVKHEA